MAEFVIAKIWYAFLGLHSQKDPLSIPRSKSTVITFHLQNITNVAVSQLFQAEFPESQYPQDISFDAYKQFLEREFIPKISSYLRQGEGGGQSTADENILRQSQTLEEALESLAIARSTSGSLSGEDLSASNSGNLNAETKRPSKKPGPLRPGSGPSKVFTWKHLEEYCWLIYLKGRLQHQHERKISDTAAFMFWLIFLTYARREGLPASSNQVPQLPTGTFTGQVATPVTMDNEELLYWLQRLQARLGLTVPQTFHMREDELSGTSTFPVALRKLETFVEENKLEPDVVCETLRDLRREAVKHVLKKAKFVINPRPNADRQGQAKAARLCRLCHNRIILNHPSKKMQGKNEPKRDLYLSMWRVKSQEGDKTRRRLVLYVPGEEIVLEAESSSIRNEWLTAIQMIINFKVDHPSQTLPLELFNFLRRCSERDERQRLLTHKKENFAEHEKEKEEALRELQDMKEKCQNLEKEKNEAIGTLAEQLQEMQERLSTMNNSYNQIQQEYEEKERSRQLMEQQLHELENEKDSTVESMKIRLAEMERIREEKTQIELEIRATLLDKEAQLGRMEAIRQTLEEALEEEKKARIMEAENARLHADLLQQEQSARAMMERLAEEKESLLANEASRREDIEKKLRDEQEKVSRICHEKMLLREQILDIKQKLKEKQEILKKYPHLIKLPTHRGLGFLSKKEIMELTVEHVVTVEVPKLVDGLDLEPIDNLTAMRDPSTEQLRENSNSNSSNSVSGRNSSEWKAIPPRPTSGSIEQ